LLRHKAACLYSAFYLLMAEGLPPYFFPTTLWFAVHALRRHSGLRACLPATHHFCIHHPAVWLPTRDLVWVLDVPPRWLRAPQPFILCLLPPAHSILARGSLILGLDVKCLVTRWRSPAAFCCCCGVTGVERR
jgi:hypothetical protein